MQLDRVTITGADDSVGTESLLKLSQEFPFVEWGILVSHKKTNTDCPRFPSFNWISDLQGIAETTGSLALSLHVCGLWVRDLLQGRMTIPEDMVHLFGRVQLTFHGDSTPCNPTPFAAAAKSLGRPIIFQVDGVNGNAHLESFYEYEGDGYPLFDISGGAGVLPREWPKPTYVRDDFPMYHGYAGGLGPQNLEEQIPLIAQAAGDARIWIDMETHVRSVDDRQFDLAKVRRCLEIASRFVSVSV